MANSRKKRPKPDLDAQIEQGLACHLRTDRPTRFCVGLSGGLDSVVLLHLLARFRNHSPCEVVAVHVHHGLSAHADAWADFVYAYAKQLHIACTIHRVQVTDRALHGLEGAARLARYAVFAEQNCDVLLLAHHQNDQAETVLLNLLRGSGVAGMAAMPLQRALNQRICLVRPLLQATRAELEVYAATHQLKWVDDESNLDQSLERNFLRHALLPQIHRQYPTAQLALARTAYHLGEAHQLQQEIAEQDSQVCVVSGVMDMQALRTLSEVRQRNVMRYWLAQQAIVPDARAFDALLLCMRTADMDSEPIWRWRTQAVRRYQQRLYVTAATLSLGVAMEIAWRPSSLLRIPQWGGSLSWLQQSGMGIAEAFLQQNLSLRPRIGGEKLQLATNRPRRLLKHLWQEKQVPPWLRDSVPLLYINDELAYVPYIGAAAQFADAHGWHMVWQPE